MEKELQSLLEGIETANNLQPYEEDFMGIAGGFKAGAKALGRAAKNAFTNTLNAAGNLNQSLNAKAQNANAKGDFVQQQKELDQQVQALANNIAKFLTGSASGSSDQAKDAKDKADKAAQANSALDKAKKKTQTAQGKVEADLKNAASASDSDSSTAGEA